MRKPPPRPKDPPYTLEQWAAAGKAGKRIGPKKPPQPKAPGKKPPAPKPYYPKGKPGPAPKPVYPKLKPGYKPNIKPL